MSFLLSARTFAISQNQQSVKILFIACHRDGSDKPSLCSSVVLDCSLLRFDCFVRGIPFIQEEEFQSLAMPWRMTATLSDSGFESGLKRFFVFPQIPRNSILLILLIVHRGGQLKELKELN